MKSSAIRLSLSKEGYRFYVIKESAKLTGYEGSTISSSAYMEMFIGTGVEIKYEIRSIVLIEMYIDPAFD